MLELDYRSKDIAATNYTPLRRSSYAALQKSSKCIIHNISQIPESYDTDRCFNTHQFTFRVQLMQ